MASHSKLCSTVPVAARHNWQELSSMPQSGAEALRAWAYWPPERAEMRPALQIGFQVSVVRAPEPLQEVRGVNYMSKVH